MAEDTKPDHAGASGRVQRSKDAVLKTTNDLMSEAGIGGVSIDEVSRRSGVAKTTIYRHWPSRSALLLDASSRLGARPQVPDTGGFAGDLAALVDYLARQLKEARWPTILPSIVDASERDADIAQMHAKLQAGFAAPYLTIIERAKQRGEIASRVDQDALVAAVFGPLFYRRWFSREPIDKPFVDGVMASVLARVAERGGAR
jgi:AcrR family transcriptional regulator